MVVSERRYQCLIIKHDVFLAMVNALVSPAQEDSASSLRDRLWAEVTLPPDAHIVTACYSFERDAFMVKIESASFAPVPAGYETPNLPPLEFK